jgi:3-hydroxyisobutyrate dehydrogenase-like beta-hydroxyacid dehydrogenase
MNITAIGAGNMGSALVKQFTRAGHENARYLEPVAGLDIYLGHGAGLGSGIAPTWTRQL